MLHLTSRRVEFVPTCLQFEDGTPPPIEDLTETPEQRARFLVRLTFCVALVGFGVVTLLHGMGSL